MKTSSMTRASVIVAPAPYVRSVKKALRASSHGQSSAVLWPLDPSSLSVSPPPEAESHPPPLTPVQWKDWPRCSIRRAWLKVVRSQNVLLESSIAADPSPALVQISSPLTRAKRAHWRLSWEERLARNARPSDAPRLIVTLHGLPTTFARSFGFALLATD